MQGIGNQCTVGYLANVHVTIGMHIPVIRLTLIITSLKFVLEFCVINVQDFGQELAV